MGIGGMAQAYPDGVVDGRRPVPVMGLSAVPFGDAITEEKQMHLTSRALAARQAGAADQIEPGDIIEGDVEDEDAAETDEQVETSKMWYYTEILETKEQRELLVALRAIVNSVNMEFGARSVFRMHADHAQELTGQKIRDELGAMEVKVTMTPGWEANNNGRAERAIALIKGRARTMLMLFVETRDQQELWPAAVSHATLLQRRLAQDRPATVPDFGQQVVCRIKATPSSSFTARGVERLSLIHI